MKKSKIVLTTMLTILSLTLFSTTTVQAALQSVPSGTTKSDTAANWIINIRKMENAGGGMGLKETINGTNGLATSESNNIDVHLLKNTEYGAIVLLGASDYGKQGTDIEARRMDYGATSGSGVQASTTGNKYGVYELGYSNMKADSSNAMYEWVAGGGSSFLSNIASRYIDRYPTANVGKAGDATIENGVDFSTWHTSSPYGYWASGAGGFMRGFWNNGVFSRFHYSATSSADARASVVCGVGL